MLKKNTIDVILYNMACKGIAGLLLVMVLSLLQLIYDVLLIYLPPSWLIDSDSDSIYQSAARDLPGLYQMKIAFIIVFLFGVFLIYALVKDFKWYLNDGTIASKFIKLGIYILGLSLIILSYANIGRTDLAQKIKSYSYHSMEILRPHIGDKYLHLRSEYYQINTKEDFMMFNEKIMNMSEDYGVTLPKLTVI